MSFSLLLNSTNFYSQANANGDTTYSVNFTNFQEGRYYLTFSYWGAQNHIDGTDCPNLYVSFQNNPNMFLGSSSSTNQVSTFLGGLNKKLLANANDGFFYASPVDNPPVYFSQKPTANFVQVRLLNRAGNVIVLHDIADPNMGAYMLTLHFHKCSDEEE